MFSSTSLVASGHFWVFPDFSTHQNITEIAWNYSTICDWFASFSAAQLNMLDAWSGPDEEGVPSHDTFLLSAKTHMRL